MTTYKNIKGKRVKTFATDLDNDQAEGQIFYSSTDNQFKTVVASAAWASSANMITARGNGGGAGTSTSAFVASGYTTTGVANTEEYNGTGFSSGGNVNTARPQTAGAGTETAGLIAGGLEPPSTGKTEEYNGTSWSEQNDMNVERRTMSGTAGTQTAALYFGGYRDITPTPNGAMNSTESYNGTSWSNEPALNTAVWGNTGDGTSTAAVSVGGPPTQTEHYDGSSWTTDAAINTAKIYSAAAGTTSNIVIYGGTTDGGDTGLTGTTELYDGTSWTEVADMAVARRGLGKAGAYNNAIAMGGLGPAKDNTEEFNITVNTVTAAAWASGGNLNTGRYELGTVGTQTAGLAFGGNRAVNSPTGLRAETEEYNGTSWSEQNDLPAAKATQGFGTQTAAVACGGTIAPNPTAGATTEEYNGSSWTSSGALNTATVAMAASTGIESAGLRAGGGSTPANRLNAVEEYNGSSWTSVTSLPSTRFQFQGTGPQTAAFFTGGNTAPPSQETTDSFDYDGTNWTSGPTMLFGMRLHAVSGNSNTSNLSFGGEPTIPGRSSTQSFDGTGFVTAPSLGTGRSDLGGCGTASASLVVGGNNAPSYDLVNTEEFTGETTSLNLKTITDS